MMTAMPRPVNIIRGKIFSGFFVSSTMLTESSKPTIEKNAIAVAIVTAANSPFSSGFSKTVMRLEVGRHRRRSRRSRSR